MCVCTKCMQRCVTENVDTPRHVTVPQVQLSSQKHVNSKELTSPYWTQMSGLLKDAVEVEHVM